MQKVLIAVVVILILLPILPKLIPKPLTMEKIEPAFTAAGLAVSGATRSESGSLGSIEELSMVVNGANVLVYHFRDEGKIAAQLEYQKQDAGSVIVEAWNMSESLGAAKPKNKPVAAGRNGMFMITATGDDKALNAQIVQIFKGL